MKNFVYYIQIWTRHDIIRVWMPANSPEEAFEIAKAKYDGVSRVSVISEFEVNDFPFYVCHLHGPVSSVAVFRYGYSERGYILRDASEEAEIDNVSNFIARAVDRGAECKVERE